MRVAPECIPCTVQSCHRLAEKSGLSPERAEALMRRTLAYLADADYSQSPPALGRELHRQLRAELDDPDPYREIKRAGNEAMMARLPGLRASIAASADPFATAVRLAVAGNVVDFGARRLLDVDESLRRVLEADLAIDDVDALRDELAGAGSVLYVGDNAGEIVLDALLVETLDHPGLAFAVRGGPVINDATLDDARLVGLDRRARLLTTGDDAPGVLWDSASPEFREAFLAADVVIAKGQGNLEGLIDLPRSTCFLLTAKCPRIAARLGVPEKSFVVWRKAPAD